MVNSFEKEGNKRCYRVYLCTRVESKRARNVVAVGTENRGGQFLFLKIKGKGEREGYTRTWSALYASIRREIGLYSCRPVLKLCRVKNLRIWRSMAAPAFHPEIPPLKSGPSEIWARSAVSINCSIGRIDAFFHQRCQLFHSCFVEFSSNLHMNDSHSRLQTIVCL